MTVTEFLEKNVAFLKGVAHDAAHEMAKAAEQGSPWSAEAAEIASQLHHMAKRSSAPPGRADLAKPRRDPSDEVPDW